MRSTSKSIIMRNSILLFLLFICNLSIAQVASPPPPPPPPQAKDFIIEEVEVEAPVSDRSQNQTYHSYNYEQSSIYEDYKWIFNKKGSNWNRDCGIIKGNKVLLPCIFKKSTYFETLKKVQLSLEGSYGIYNIETQEWDIPIGYSNISALGKDLYSVKKDGKYGIVDGYNNPIIDFNLSSINKISGLENYVLFTKKNNTSSQYGILNLATRKATVKPIYKSISKLEYENYFKVKNEVDLYNIIDVNGKVRFKKWYKEIYPAQKGRRFYIVKVDEKMGVIDENEKVIVPISYLSINTRPYKDGSYLAKNNKNKFGFITIDGTVTLPFKYDQMKVQGYSDVAISTKNDKCGLIQINSGLPFEIATCDYDDIQKNNNIFIVEQGGKFGIMDLYGKMIVQPKFDLLNALKNKLFIGKEKGKFYLLDSNGTVLNSQAYDDLQIIIDKLKSSYSINFSYLKAKYNGKYAIIDKTGNKITENIFDELAEETNNLVITSKKGKFGVYNILLQKPIVEHEYDQIILRKTGGFYAIKGSEISKITVGRKITIKKL